MHVDGYDWIGFKTCRPHDIEIRSSVVRPPVCATDCLWSYYMDFFHILVVASLGPYPRAFFDFLLIKFGGWGWVVVYEYFSFSLTWDLVGAKISKRYSYKSQWNVSKLVLNFLLKGPHKNTFGVFEILKIEHLTIFFCVFVNIGPRGSEISKRYSSYKSQPNVADF